MTLIVLIKYPFQIIYKRAPKLIFPFAPQAQGEKIDPFKTRIILYLPQLTDE